MSCLRALQPSQSTSLSSSNKQSTKCQGGFTPPVPWLDPGVAGLLTFLLSCKPTHGGFIKLSSRKPDHKASQSGPESGHKPGSWRPGPVLFVAGTTPSNEDFMESGCPGKTRPRAGGMARACFNSLICGYMGVTPCLSSRKAELLCGEPPQPHPTPEIWATSGPGAHKESLAEIKNDEVGMAATCRVWVLRPRSPAIQRK